MQVGARSGLHLNSVVSPRAADDLTCLTRRSLMAKKQIDANPTRGINAQPRLHQRAGEIKRYGTVNHALPLETEEAVRLQMTEQLNQLPAATMTLRDLD